MKNLGLLLIVLGALTLIIGYFANLVDYNWFNVCSLLLIIIGIITHIAIHKRDK